MLDLGLGNEVHSADTLLYLHPEGTMSPIVRNVGDRSFSDTHQPTSGSDKIELDAKEKILTSVVHIFMPRTIFVSKRSPLGDLIVIRNKLQSLRSRSPSNLAHKALRMS